MMLIDTHCHLDFDEFVEDIEQVLWRARRVGVERILIPAVGADNWQKIANLCACYQEMSSNAPQLAAAYGLHPVFYRAHQPAHLWALADWLAQYRTLAIGECGLDGSLPIELEAQKSWLFAQIELAQQFDLPLIFHARQALEPLLQSLRQFKNLRFIVHSFSGSDQQLAQIFRLGGIVGIGGSVTYPRASRLRRQVSKLHKGQYVLETDAPSQTPYRAPTLRNQPSYLFDIARIVAELQQKPIDCVSAESSQTAINYLNW